MGPGSRSASKQALCAQVFIEIRPMDTGPAPADLPVGTLFRRGMEKARIAGDRDNDCTAIQQVHTHRVFCKSNIFDVFFGPNIRTIHSRPLTCRLGLRKKLYRLKMEKSRTAACKAERLLHPTPALEATGPGGKQNTERIRAGCPGARVGPQRVSSATGPAPSNRSRDLGSFLVGRGAARAL